MEELAQHKNSRKPAENPMNWPLLSWTLFMFLFLGAIFVVFGFPFGPIAIAVIGFLIFFSYRATYVSFYLAVFFVVFLGLTVSIPTGSLKIGERAFGGSIDIFFGEIFFLAVLCAWMIKVFVLWFKRRDKNWHPTLPIWQSYGLLVLAHITSVFSSYEPDPIVVFKYILRPVMFCYIAFIALPSNLIRSVRRLKAVLAVLTAVGIVAALNAFVSLGASPDPFQSVSVRRAHPIALFGINPIGDNHNLLAELLVMTGPMTLALGLMAKKTKTRFFLFMVAGAQMLAALLTLSRTAWIIFLIQTVFLFLTIWRETLKNHLVSLIFFFLILSPLALYQLNFSFSPTAQSSNSTRLMLTDIAWQAFLEHPFIGGGAGTFLWHVGNASIFIQEFGWPLDSHGFIQKLMAETGSFGVLAYLIILLQSAWLVFRKLRKLTGVSRDAGYLLAASASGAVIYQMSNTAYWTAHLWLPIGILFAALAIFSRVAAENPDPFAA